MAGCEYADAFAANLESMVYSNNVPLTEPQVRQHGGKFGAETIASDVVVPDGASATEGTRGLPSLFPNPAMPYIDRTSAMLPDSSDCNLRIPTEKSTIDQADLGQL